MKEFKQELSAKELLEMYSSTIYRIAYSHTHNKADAEDITQNVFLKYISADKKWRDEEHRKAWLIRVAVNCTHDFVTSAHYRYRSDAEELPDNGSEDSYEIEEKSDVYYAVQSLPEKYRIPIHLFYYEEMSIAEIAAATSTKESTVKSQLSRARDMLRKILKEESV